MCTLVEEYAKDFAKEQSKEFALYMIKEGKSDVEIISVTHLTADEVAELRNH